LRDRIKRHDQSPFATHAVLEQPQMSFWFAGIKSPWQIAMSDQPNSDAISPKNTQKSVHRVEKTLGKQGFLEKTDLHEHIFTPQGPVIKFTQTIRKIPLCLAIHAL
jgi:hypothetical protein